MKMELCCCESTLLDEIKDKRLKQINIAQTYSLALRSSEKDINWKKINIAIIDRWSLSGLLRIKRLAWSGKCFKE